MKEKSHKMRNRDKKKKLTKKQLLAERTEMCFTEAEKVIAHFKRRHKERMDFKKEKGYKITEQDREDGKMIEGYYEKRGKVKKVKFEDITTASAPLTAFDEHIDVEDLD